MAGEREDIIQGVEESFDSIGNLAFDATIRRTAEGDYVAGVGKTPVTTTTTCKVVFDESQRLTSSFLRDMVVKPGMKILYIQGPQWAPLVGDLVIISGRDEIVLEWVDDIAQLGALYTAIGA